MPPVTSTGTKFWTTGTPLLAPTFHQDPSIVDSRDLEILLVTETPCINGSPMTLLMCGARNEVRSSTGWGRVALSSLSPSQPLSFVTLATATTSKNNTPVMQHVATFVCKSHRWLLLSLTWASALL